LIIGGGPGGSTAATLIAAKGKDVVLLEKDAHPRFHIGESLLPRNIPILERLGILDEVASMGVLKPGAEFVLDETGRSVEFNFAKGLDREYTYAYQVKRADFDEALFANARRRGARTYERTLVTDVVFGATGERARVSAENSNHQTRVFAPKLVIDASGRDSFLANRLRLLNSNKHDSTAAVFAHFRKVERKIGNMAGDITIHLVKDGWFWMIPLPGDIMSVGFVGNQATFKNRRGSVQEFFFEKMRNSPTVSTRMTLAELASEVITAGNYSYCATSACGEGYFIIGDAFAFIDPVFSTGVLLAMTGGEIGAEVAVRWLDDPKAGLAMARKGERRMRNSMDKIGWFIYRINHPVLREMFMAPSDRFRMRAGLVSILAGNVQSEWQYSAPLVAFKCMFYALSAAYLFGFRLSPA
jgi:flavin-dependent dehydrogenase